MTRLRRHVARTGRFWLALLAILTLLQGLQPLLHAHPRGEDDAPPSVETGTPAPRFAVHLPDSEVTHALAERSGPAPVTVTAECERCRSIDGWALPPVVPLAGLSVLFPPDTHLQVPHVIRPAHQADPFDPQRSPRGPPAA